MVTELVKSENSYQTAFRTLRELSPTAPWLELVRGSAMDRFEQLGFPSVREEDWKYTNLASLAKESFVPAISGGELAVADVSRFAFRETTGAHLVVVNGFLRDDLSVTAALDSVVAIDLFSATADARYNKIVRKYLARSASYFCDANREFCFRQRWQVFHKCDRRDRRQRWRAIGTLSFAA